MNAEKRSAKIYKNKHYSGYCGTRRGHHDWLFPWKLDSGGCETYRVKTNTIREVWKCFCETGETSIKRFYGTSKHLQKEDIVVVTFETMNLAILVQGYIY